MLTLDPFAMMSRTLHASILEEAQRLANQDGNITAEDRRQNNFPESSSGGTA